MLGGGEQKLVHGGDPNYQLGAQRAGDAFVASKGYQAIKDSAARPSQWSSGPVEIKATLFEGDHDTPQEGGALVQVDARPGVMPVLFQPLTVASLLATAQTTSSRVRTVVETVADAGAIGTVAEGAVKPEATLEFDEVDEPVRKIASFLPVSDELLADAPAIQGYLNSRLSLFVQTEEENQLLNGDGTGTDLDGLLNRIPPANEGVISAVAGSNAADHIYSAIVAVQASFLDADGVVINPADWADLRLLKDQNDGYIGGSPFSNGPVQPGESLFGKQVVVTQSIAEGTALVGAFATGAQIFRRGGLSVEASNSHADFFQKDLVAIRAETRLALCVYRPEAFATASLTGS